jgi:glycosyltransferase involved in cell wall biosynthesis
MLNLIHKYVWQSLPRRLRRHALVAITERMAPKPDPHTSSQPGPIHVVGAFRTASGLGESARLCLQSLEKSGQATSSIDIGPLFLQTDDLAPAPQHNISRVGPGTAILHVNGPFIPMALCYLGRSFVKQKRLIGYWAWELPKAPPEWRIGTRYVHEIWVPSHFTAKAVLSIADIPVHVLPHPLPLPDPRRRPRSEFGLPDHCFIFVCAFSMGSSLERKNPLAAVAAFNRAFGDSKAVHLAIRVSNPGAAPWAMAQLRQMIGEARNISVNAEMLSRTEFQDWLFQADAVISLHRAEGFGLVAAEAMQLGRPVIATNWSGNLDFMTPENSALVDFKLIPARDRQGTYDFPDQKWADPDVDHAACWMTKLVNSPNLVRKLGERAAKDIAVKFSQRAYNDRVGERLLSMGGRGAIAASAI